MSGIIKKKGLNGFFEFQMFLDSEGPNIMGQISLFDVALKKPSHGMGFRTKLFFSFLARPYFY